MSAGRQRFARRIARPTKARAERAARTHNLKQLLYDPLRPQRESDRRASVGAKGALQGESKPISILTYVWPEKRLCKDR